MLLDSSERTDLSSGTDHEGADSAPRCRRYKIFVPVIQPQRSVHRFTVLKFTGSQFHTFRPFQVIDLTQLCV